MKRASLTHFLAIKSEEFIAVKASIQAKKTSFPQQALALQVYRPRRPFENIWPFSSRQFTILIQGLDEAHNKVWEKLYTTDQYGGVQIKIPLTGEKKSITALTLYETSTFKGIKQYLGTYLPHHLPNPAKIIICDFDKTLVDTRYSTPKEVFQSLTRPISFFPAIETSIQLLKGNIEKGLTPFILSASPHFYEEAIRDWLYRNQIFTAGIFLKDYRRIFSPFDRELTSSDIKHQWVYKLGHLLDILAMTGIPHELVLMGDNFESDPVIYALLAHLLKNPFWPREIVQMLKTWPYLQMSYKQEAKLLNRLHYLQANLKKSPNDLNLKIYIRKKAQENLLKLPAFFDSSRKYFDLYEGLSKPRIEP